MIDSSSVASTGGERLALLRALGLVSQLSESVFDHLSAAATVALGATGARIGVLDGAADVVVGSAGPAGGAERLAAFGRAVVESGEALVGRTDGTFEPGTRGGLGRHAGVPLLSAAGEGLGFLCAFDDRPREWSPAEMTTLRELAWAAVGALELCLEKLLLESLKESSPDGVLVVSLDRRVVSYNRRFVEIWRISDEVLTSGSDDALLDRVVSLVRRPEEFRARLEELYADPEEEVCDEIILRDGRVFSRCGVPIVSGNGVPRGRMWLFRDITTAGRHNRAVPENEERLRAFIESASDAAFTVDEASVITYANSAVERIFGYPPAELVGRPLTTLVPERLRAARLNGPERQGASGIRRIPWGAMELTGLHRDGREIPVEISFGKFVSGGRTFYTGIVRDIAERKEVERVMRDAAVSYRSLFDSLDELVCITDLDRTILSVNEAVIQRHGFSREEILGATPEMLTAHGWTDATGGLERVYAELGAEPVRLEWWGRTRDGDLFPMEVVLTRGEYFGAPVVIGVGRDISQRMEAERALRESEEKFRQIAENIREDFWIFDAGFQNAIYISPAHEAVWGFPVEQAYREPRSFLNGVLPEDLSALRTAMERVGAGESVRVEYRHRMPDGAIRWAWSRAFPVLDETGEVYRVVGTTEDVTERKEAEQALRWLGTIVESSVDAIVSSSVHGLVTSWNAAAERIFGYTREEIIGREWLIMVPPEERERYDLVRQGIRDGAAPPYEAVRVRKDGVRIHVAIAAFPIHDGAGEVTGTAAIIRDITETKAREEQRQLLAAALERLDEGVMLATLDGEMIYANENHGRILGYDASLRPLPSLHDFADADTAAEEKEILRSIVEEGGWVGRVRRRRKDDRRLIPLELIMGRIDREGDEPTLLFGIIRDISDELEQERYLRRAERLASVGTLVSGAAHELNNPLHAVRSFAELMLMEPRPNDDLEALEIIKREADRAAKIVSDLRLFARQTQGDSSERSAVDLNEVVRHVVKVRRYSLDTRGIAIVDELTGDIPPVRANRGEVEQVVLNLLVNAEQAMAGEGGERRLLLRTGLGGSGITLLVGDTGPGIVAEHRDRIFDPFFTTKPPGEGTGLGLSIVHSIVAEHGGRIQVESSSSGTTFLVELPEATRADLPQSVDPAGPPLATRELRVLVADEDDSARRATARYLTRLGYHVDTATDGAETRRLLDAWEYDAMVCDLRMRGLDGESLLRLLQQQGGGLDRRLVFLTGDASGTPGLVQLAAQGIPVLLKPIRLEEVGREVQRVIGAHPSSSAVQE